jgi:glycosyltransferase involved in cell wall biosynthesis
VRSTTAEASAPFSQSGQSADYEVSVVIPCLNEAETVGLCVRKAQSGMSALGVNGEVIVADNGSDDGSPDLAARSGARVIHVEQRGYGAAIQGGMSAARGRYIIIGDADDSYDFTAIGPFVDELRMGNDLVVGNRFRGELKPGAMPWLNRYIGNPVLSNIGRLLFRSPCGDFHCGLRAIRRSAADRLNLRSTGMEFASEMLVKASLFGLRVTEVPITLSPAGRSRRPHLRPWRDGWRHLRFLLLFRPRWLFLYPGLALMVLGLALMGLVLPGSRRIGSVTLDVHTLLYGGAAVVIGLQAVLFATFARIFAIREGFLPDDPRLRNISRLVTLERGLVAGSLLVLAGLAGSIYAVVYWGNRSFGALNYQDTFRIVIPSVVLLTAGFQTIFSSVFLSFLGLRDSGRLR